MRFKILSGPTVHDIPKYIEQTFKQAWLRVVVSANNPNEQTFYRNNQILRAAMGRTLAFTR